MKQIPFYENASDGKHCTQASMRMVLKHFEPEYEFTWDQIDEMTAYLKDKGSWASATLITMKKRGYDVVEISTFNSVEFIRECGDYLLARYGKEAGKYAIENSDLSAEQSRYLELNDLNLHIDRIPHLDDIKLMLQKGYLVCCTINARRLNNEAGFAGHYIVVYSATDDGLYINDPGPTAIQERFVTNENFEYAWSIPTEETKLLYAFRK
jgi:hypothetical protein